MVVAVFGLACTLACDCGTTPRAGGEADDGPSYEAPSVGSLELTPVDEPGEEAPRPYDRQLVDPGWRVAAVDEAGTRIAVIDGDDRLALIDAITLEPAWTAPGSVPSTSSTGIAFSADGARVAWASTTEVEVLRAEDGQRVGRWRGEDFGYAREYAAGPASTGSVGGTVPVAPSPNDATAFVLWQTVALDPDAGTLAWAERDAMDLAEWEARREALEALPLPECDRRSIVLDEPLRRAVTRCGMEKIHLTDLDSGETLYSREISEVIGEAVDVLADNRILMRNRARRYHVVGAEETTPVGVPAEGHIFGWADGGETLVAVFDDGHPIDRPIVWLVDVDTGQTRCVSEPMPERTVPLALGVRDDRAWLMTTSELDAPARVLELSLATCELDVARELDAPVRSARWLSPVASFLAGSRLVSPIADATPPEALDAALARRDGRLLSGALDDGSEQLVLLNTRRGQALEVVVSDAPSEWRRVDHPQLETDLSTLSCPEGIVVGQRDGIWLFPWSKLDEPRQIDGTSSAAGELVGCVDGRLLHRERGGSFSLIDLASGRRKILPTALERPLLMPGRDALVDVGASGLPVYAIGDASDGGDDAAK